MSEQKLSASEMAKGIYHKYPGLELKIAEVFGSTNQGDRWLATPIPALGGKSPLDVIKQGDINLVLVTLNKIERGEYS